MPPAAATRSSRSDAMPPDFLQALLDVGIDPQTVTDLNNAYLAAYNNAPPKEPT